MKYKTRAPNVSRSLQSLLIVLIVLTTQLFELTADVLVNSDSNSNWAAAVAQFRLSQPRQTANTQKKTGGFLFVG